MRDPIKYISISQSNRSFKKFLFDTLSEVVDPKNFAIREAVQTLWTERVEGKLVFHKTSYVLVKNEEDAFLLAMKYR